MKDILRYREIIEATLESSNFGGYPKELYDPIHYFLSLGGKRLRPILTLMGCDVFGGNIDKSINAALAVEIFHNFTLVHDDIMDKAPLRRNQATVHNKWNENIAILSGDVMLVKAYQELAKSEADKLPALLKIFSETAVKVCEGQQMDMNFETQPKVSILQYEKMIEYKTAVLLGGALQMGAVIADAEDIEAKAIYEFGKNIGIAFQLQDDLLDVYGDTEKFGKQKGGDIVSNKKTFLLLKAIEMAESNRYKKEELHQWINAPEFDVQDKVEAIINIYDFFDIKRLSKNEMDKYFSLAMKNLNQLNTVSSEKKELLKSFAESLMVRES